MYNQLQGLGCALSTSRGTKAASGVALLTPVMLTEHTLVQYYILHKFISASITIKLTRGVAANTHICKVEAVCCVHVIIAIEESCLSTNTACIVDVDRAGSTTKAVAVRDRCGICSGDNKQLLHTRTLH